MVKERSELINANFMYFALGILLFILLWPLDIKDIPAYTPNEVLEMATAYSPECKIVQCG